MMHSALPPAEALTLVPLADIARGGMGMVQLCRATDGRLQGRALAVKRLNPALEEEPEFVNMFLDETWITATIDSPHVVHVEAWGRDEDGLFLAVELVEGVSLSRLIKESKEKQEPFAERTVAFLASQVCDGLSAAHELRSENGQVLGLVHRDLTPGNLLVGFDGMVKIADFGIAKAEERLTNTRIGMMKGKPAYMAPEQARGGGIDARADLFALGVVMFELLAGRRPWLGTNDLETLVNVTTKEPPSLAELRKTSPLFVDIVNKCLKKNPTHRFNSAAEIKQLLDGWRRERGFEADDKQSLAAFVQRNTAQQQAWFREALNGQLVRGGLAFMDLEAGIDKGRKRRTEGPTSSQQVNRPVAPQNPPQAAPMAPGPPLAKGATIAMTSADLMPQNGSRSAGLEEEPDDEAKTKFLESNRGSPAATLFAEAAPTTLASATPKSGSLNSTVALSPDEAAAMSARFAAVQAGAAGTAASAGGMGSTLQSGTSPLANIPNATPAEGGEAFVWQPTKPKRSKAWLLLLLLVLLAAGGAVYYFVLRPRYHL